MEHIQITLCVRIWLTGESESHYFLSAALISIFCLRKFCNCMTYHVFLNIDCTTTNIFMPNLTWFTGDLKIIEFAELVLHSKLKHNNLLVFKFETRVSVSLVKLMYSSLRYLVRLVFYPHQFNFSSSIYCFTFIVCSLWIHIKTWSTLILDRRCY